MKKNYYVPATDVIAFIGGAIMQSGSPAQTSQNPNDNSSANGGSQIPD